MATTKKTEPEKVVEYVPTASERLATLEHTQTQIVAHYKGECAGAFCTLHNRSEHASRSFPQRWRADKGIMERICVHGVGHTDPDEYRLIDEPHLSVHGCDGCCGSLPA